MTSYDVLGIGSPILDYIIHVDDQFLKQVPGKKGGMEPIDLDTLQDLLKKAGSKPHITPGGSCSNTIRGLTYLGFRCALLGMIGHDNAANQYMAFIKNTNIIPLFHRSELPTSQVVCLITPDGERTCRTYLGASQDIHLEKITPELFKGIKLVHIEGYSLLQGILPEKVMKLAKEAGVTISFDLASFELVEQFKERILFLLSHYVDIAFANEYEIKTLTGVSGEKGCQYLKDLTRTAIVMQSSQGVWASTGSQIVYQHALDVKVVDSIGAGDLFASGFLAGFLTGKSIEDCARIGNIMGAAVVQVHGTEIALELWQQFKNELNM